MLFLTLLYNCLICLLKSKERKWEESHVGNQVSAFSNIVDQGVKKKKKERTDEKVSDSMF